MIRKLLLPFFAGLVLSQLAMAQVPVASFTQTGSLTGCAPLVINFSSTSTPAGVSLFWNFGASPPDVNIPNSTSATPVVVYNTPGTYYVTLQATNASGTSTTTPVTVTVNPVPVASFSANPVSGCFPLNVQFSDLSKPGNGATITQYQWDFGDGSPVVPSTNGSPMHTYTLAGSFAVSLQVANSFGCQGSASLLSNSGFITITNGVLPSFSDSLSTSCKPPTNVYFSNQTTGPGTLTYSWNFGDGTGTVTGTNPTHVFANSGNYRVVLTATSSAGCSDTTSVVTTINSSNVKSVISAPDSVCTYQVVSFQNNSTPSPNSVIWDFGDGSPTSTQTNPAYAYPTAGIYTVKLKNTFATCSDSVSQKIQVFLPSVANFSATNLSSCRFPLTVNFTNQSTNASNWLWNFGDGTSSTQANPSHTYTTYGTYNVTLTASNAVNCSGTITKNALVQVEAPTVKITNLPFYSCSPASFTPTASIVAVDGVSSYSWNFGNGNTFNGANPPTQSYGPGKYLVSLTITTNGGCSASYQDTVKVGTSQPVANFTASPTSVCAANPVQFTDQSTGSPNQWFWNFGDGTTDSAENPIHNYTTPGSYTILMTAYNNGCGNTIQKTNYIVVNPPLAAFAYSFNCSNKSQYTFTDHSIGAISWDWNFGDGSAHYTAGPNPPLHTYPNTSASYTVTLTVKGSTGCSNTTTQTINVLSMPVVYSSSNPVCDNTQVYIITQNVGNVATFTYDFGDGTGRIGPIASGAWGHKYTAPGTYTTKVIFVDTTGCTDSVTYSLQVNGPKANFSSNDTISCGSSTAKFNDLSTSDGRNAIIKWVWDYGDGTIQTYTDGPFAHTYASPGKYPVKLTVTDASGCSDSLLIPNYIIVSDVSAQFTTTDSMFCPSSYIRFTNVSTGGFNPVYNWNFGNGNTFAGTNPPLQNYPNVGQYTVSLTVTDSYNCTATYTKTNYITIDTPHASFTMDKNFSSCPPLLVHFTFTGHYAKSVQYSFGGINEGVSDTLNPQHVYALPGTYYPTLTVTSPGGCIATAKDSIVILGPTGAFSYSPTGACDSLTVNFSVATTGVVGFVWYFGDGDSLVNTTPSATHLYTNAGTSTPVLVLQDTSSCRVTLTGTTPIIIDSVKAKFISSKNLLCSSGTVQFNDSSYTGNGTVITNYYWDFGDGNTTNIAAKTQTHFYAAPGLYTVKMVATTQFGCQDSAFQQIKIVDTPHVDIVGLVSQCQPATENYIGAILVADTSAFTWNWNFGNQDSSTQQTPPAVSYPKAGYYPVTLTATNSSGCKGSVEKDLFIYPSPTIFAGQDTTICLGQSLPLNATGGVGYIWLPPSNSSLSCSNCNNPIATPAQTTSYIVSGSSVNGCFANDTVVVTVNTPVTVTASPTSDSLCLGQSARLTASGAALYAWSPAAGLSSTTIPNPVAAPTTTTNYQVIGSDNKYCFSDTQYVQVNVFNYPTLSFGPNVSIPVGSSYQITGAGSSDIVSVNWLPDAYLSCNNCLSPLASPVHTTTYIATAVNNGGCAVTDSITIKVICTEANFFVPNTFSPNGDGVNDVFYVQGKGLNIISSLVIFNRWGQIVFEKRDFAPNDPAVGWDGTFNGKKAPMDVYVYTLSVICNNSSLIPYHGNVTLIR